MVCPTICGNMVEARLQVLMTRFSFLAFMASTFLSSFGSMKGPFLSERDIALYPLLLAFLTATANNKLIRPVVLAGFIAHCWLAPGRLGAWHTDGRTALATAVRVAAGVHCRSAYSRAPAHPTLAASLADLDVAVVNVADLTHCRHALFAYHTHFAAWQANLCKLVLAPDQLGRCTGGTHHLRATPTLQLDGMDEGANGDVAQGQCIAFFEGGARPAHQRVAYLQAQRGQDIALFAVHVMQQGDAGGSVRVILDGGNLRGDTVLVPLEINDTQVALVAAPAMAHRHVSRNVAPGLAPFFADERTLRLRFGDLLEAVAGHPTATGGSGLVDFNRHGSVRPQSWCRGNNPHTLP